MSIRYLQLHIGVAFEYAAVDNAMKSLAQIQAVFVQEEVSTFKKFLSLKMSTPHQWSGTGFY